MKLIKFAIAALIAAFVLTGCVERRYIDTSGQGYYPTQAAYAASPMVQIQTVAPSAATEPPPAWGAYTLRRAKIEIPIVGRPEGMAWNKPSTRAESIAVGQRVLDQARAYTNSVIGQRPGAQAPLTPAQYTPGYARAHAGEGDFYDWLRDNWLLALILLLFATVLLWLILGRLWERREERAVVRTNGLTQPVVEEVRRDRALLPPREEIRPTYYRDRERPSQLVSEDDVLRRVNAVEGRQERLERRVNAHDEQLTGLRRDVNQHADWLEGFATVQARNAELLRQGNRQIESVANRVDANTKLAQSVQERNERLEREFENANRVLSGT